MEKEDKRRQTPRNPIEALFVCRPFTSGDPGHMTDAIMRNFSNNGSYVESSRGFNIGTILHLRLVNYSQQSTCKLTDHQPRSISLAEVRWRQKLAEAGVHRYGLGLKNL
jgi:hypothetical protein